MSDNVADIALKSNGWRRWLLLGKVMLLLVGPMVFLVVEAFNFVRRENPDEGPAVVGEQKIRAEKAEPKEAPKARVVSAPRSIFELNVFTAETLTNPQAPPEVPQLLQASQAHVRIGVIPAEVRAMRFLKSLPDCVVLITARNGKISLEYQPVSGVGAKAPLDLESNAVQIVDCDPAGELLLVQSAKGDAQTISIWSIQDHKKVVHRWRPKHSQLAASFLTDKNRILTIGSDGTTSLWTFPDLHEISAQPSTLSLVHRLPVHMFPDSLRGNLAIHTDRALVAIPHDNGFSFIDVGTCKLSSQTQGIDDFGNYWCAAFDKPGKLLAARLTRCYPNARLDIREPPLREYLLIANASTGALLDSIPVHFSRQNKGVISWVGEHLLILWDHTLSCGELWDTKTKQLVRLLVPGGWQGRFQPDLDDDGFLWYCVADSRHSKPSLVKAKLPLNDLTRPAPAATPGVFDPRKKCFVWYFTEEGVESRCR